MHGATHQKLAVLRQNGSENAGSDPKHLDNASSHYSTDFLIRETMLDQQELCWTETVAKCGEIVSYQIKSRFKSKSSSQISQFQRGYATFYLADSIKCFFFEDWR